MSIKQWPAGEQPREKLIQRGAAALSDAELLAVFLRVGTRGKSAVDLAREMLERFQGLRGVIAASRHEFCQVPGLGATKYALIHAAIEIGRRYIEDDIRHGEILDKPHATKDYLKMKLAHKTHEVFACLFLDARHKVLQFDELFRGTIDGAHVHPRDIVRRALDLNAKSVIFAHNHPSGVAEPSRADRAMTEKLQRALGLIDVDVIDHFIIGDGAPVSFAERGLL